LIKDPLQPHYEYLKKTINGITVTLHHIEKTKKNKEDWYVEIALGGAIPTKHFGINEKSARIYYDSINTSVISAHKEIMELKQKISNLRLKVIYKLQWAVFQRKALGKFEKI
jgi:hypothetical protein